MNDELEELCFDAAWKVQRSNMTHLLAVASPDLPNYDHYREKAAQSKTDAAVALERLREALNP